MRANEVMKILNIARSTLYRYTRDGLITVTKLDNGYYDYNEESVFKLLKRDNRINIIYARVSTYKQKNDLQRQANAISEYCKNNNIIISDIFKEIASGIDFDRPDFNKLIDLVINLKVKAIYISNKDRLTRLSFKTIEFLFSKFHTDIIVINDEAHKSNDKEIFEELISLMHIFSTTMYSHHRKQKINIISEDIKNYLKK